MVGLAGLTGEKKKQKPSLDFRLCMCSKGGLGCNVWNKSQTRLPHSRDRSDAGDIRFPFSLPRVWVGSVPIGRVAWAAIHACLL